MYTKESTKDGITTGTKRVSIPFKREGVYKEYNDARKQIHKTYSFNSLQTGRCIQRHLKASRQFQRFSFNSLQTGKLIQRLHTSTSAGPYVLTFQFSSNGKADTKSPILSPVGPWLRNAKTIRELRRATFSIKI